MTLGSGSVVVAVAFAHLVFAWRPAEAQHAPRPRWTVGALFIQFDRPASGGRPLPQSRGFTRWGVEFGDPTQPRTFAAQMWGVRFATGMGSLRTGLAFTVLYRW